MKREEKGRSGIIESRLEFGRINIEMKQEKMLKIRVFTEVKNGLNKWPENFIHMQE